MAALPSKGQVTSPKRIRDALHVSPGATVVGANYPGRRPRKLSPGGQDSSRRPAAPNTHKPAPTPAQPHQLKDRTQALRLMGLLAHWVGECGAQLQPLVPALADELRRHPVLHADETPVAMLKPGNKKTQQGLGLELLHHPLQPGAGGGLRLRADAQRTKCA